MFKRILAVAAIAGTALFGLAPMAYASTPQARRSCAVSIKTVLISTLITNTPVGVKEDLSRNPCALSYKAHIKCRITKRDGFSKIERQDGKTFEGTGHWSQAICKLPALYFERRLLTGYIYIYDAGWHACEEWPTPNTSCKI